MKELIIELRLYIAEKLLNWAFTIVSSNKQGTELRIAIMRYFYKSPITFTPNQITKFQKKFEELGFKINN